MRPSFFYGLILIALLGCRIDPPLEEYNLARSAVAAAEGSNAARYAPGTWHKAEQAYKQAEALFREGDHNSAKKLFDIARSYAEKAEMAAKVTRAKSGEDF